MTSPEQILKNTGFVVRPLRVRDPTVTVHTTGGAPLDGQRGVRRIRVVYFKPASHGARRGDLTNTKRQKCTHQSLGDMTDTLNQKHESYRQQPTLTQATRCTYTARSSYPTVDQDMRTISSTTALDHSTTRFIAAHSKPCSGVHNAIWRTTNIREWTSETKTRAVKVPRSKKQKETRHTKIL